VTALPVYGENVVIVEKFHGNSNVCIWSPMVESAINANLIFPEKHPNPFGTIAYDCEITVDAERAVILQKIDSLERIDAVDMNGILGADCVCIVTFSDGPK
jgi:hypothetical protein